MKITVSHIPTEIIQTFHRSCSHRVAEIHIFISFEWDIKIQKTEVKTH